MGRRFLLIDGHPDANRLSGHLLDLYQQALPAGTALDRIAIRDLDGTIRPVREFTYDDYRDSLS